MLLHRLPAVSLVVENDPSRGEPVSILTLRWVASAIRP